MSLPTVSVLMSSHNAQRYLPEALDSILQQTFRDFECIVIDDDSTDNSWQIVAEFAQRDRRVKPWRREKKVGYTRNLNWAIEMASGRFFARMDADDISMPERFEKQIAFLECHPECVAVGAQVDFVDEDGDLLCEFNVPLTHEEIEQRLWRGDSLAIVHPCVMMRGEVVRMAGGYRPHTETSEDLDLYLRLAEHGQLANLPDRLLKFRRHPASVTAVASGEEERKRKLAILREAAARRGLSEQGIVLGEFPVARNVAEWYAEWAFRIWKRRGDLRVARKHLWRGFCKGPFCRHVWRAFVCVMLRQPPPATVSKAGSQAPRTSER